MEEDTRKRRRRWLATLASVSESATDSSLVPSSSFLSSSPHILSMSTTRPSRFFTSTSLLRLTTSYSSSSSLPSTSRHSQLPRSSISSPPTPSTLRPAAPSSSSLYSSDENYLARRSVRSSFLFSFSPSRTDRGAGLQDGGTCLWWRRRRRRRKKEDLRPSSCSCSGAQSSRRLLLLFLSIVLLFSFYLHPVSAAPRTSPVASAALPFSSSSSSLLSSDASHRKSPCALSPSFLPQQGTSVSFIPSSSSFSRCSSSFSSSLYPSFLRAFPTSPSSFSPLCRRSSPSSFSSSPSSSPLYSLHFYSSFPSSSSSSFSPSSFFSNRVHLSRTSSSFFPSFQAKRLLPHTTTSSSHRSTPQVSSVSSSTSLFQSLSFPLSFFSSFLKRSSPGEKETKEKRKKMLSALTSFFTSLWSEREKEEREVSSLKESRMSSLKTFLSLFFKRQKDSFCSLTSTFPSFLTPPPLPPLVPFLQGSLIATYLLDSLYYKGSLSSSLSFDMYRELKLLRRKLHKRHPRWGGEEEGRGGSLLIKVEIWLEFFLRSMTSCFVHGNLLHLIVNLKGIAKVFPVTEKLFYQAFFGSIPMPAPSANPKHSRDFLGVPLEFNRTIPAVHTPHKNLYSCKTPPSKESNNSPAPSSTSYFSFLNLLQENGDLSVGHREEKENPIHQWCGWISSRDSLQGGAERRSRRCFRGGSYGGYGKQGWLARFTVLLLFLTGNACGNMTSFFVRRWWSGVQHSVETFMHETKKRRKLWGGIVRDEEVLQDQFEDLHFDEEEEERPEKNKKKKSPARKNLKIWERQLRLAKMKKWKEKEHKRSTTSFGNKIYDLEEEEEEEDEDDDDGDKKDEIDPSTWCVRTLGCSGGLYSLLGLLVGSARVDASTKRDILHQLARRILTEIFAPVGSTGLDEPGHLGGFLFGILAANLLAC